MTDDPFEFDTLEVDTSHEPYKEKKMATKQNATLPLTNDRPRLSVYAHEGGFTRLEDIEGMEMLLHSFELLKSETYGKDFYKTGATDTAGTVHVLALGQTLVKPAIDALLEASEDNPDFPIAARFVKKGRAWTLE